MTLRAPLALALGIAVAATGCGGDASKRAAARPQTSRSVPKPQHATGLAGQIVEVGGHRMYFACFGRGSPTVLLEAGFGGDSRGWAAVMPGLVATTRTCSYDRAGLGNSSPIHGLQDADDQIRDLEVLLSRAEIRPPYVLVGHSYGGILMQLFAFEHPRQTAGVVLIDSSHPDQPRRMAQALAAAHVPPRFRHLALPFVADGVALRRSFALGRRVSSLGRTPLVVITAGEADPLNNLPPRVSRVFARSWLALQNDLAALSSDHVHAVALYSDHFVQGAGGQPDVVTRAVRTVVRAAREHRSLPSCRDTFHGLAGVRCL